MYEILSGSWSLYYSTFPMWHRTGVGSVTFNYAPTIEHGERVLRDEVRYRKNGKARSLKGYDIADANDDTTYTWHGAGLLWLITSRWRVEYMNQSRDCMIVSFGKTLFTPAGLDILCKGTASLEAEMMKAINYAKSNGLMKDVKDPLLPVALS